MAPIVAAAGVLAGGAAAHALGADKNLTGPPGGGIPGLTSSKGAGKEGNGPGYAIQVDPSTAINYFQQAAAAQKAGFEQGIQYYGNSIKQATDSINNGYQQGNDTLTPLSYSSNAALTQEMRMLGLTPLQPTATFGGALQTEFQSVKDTLPGAAAGDIASIVSQMNSMGSIQDPTARKQALTSLQNSVNGIGPSLDAQLQAQINSYTAPTIGYTPGVLNSMGAYPGDPTSQALFGGVAPYYTVNGQRVDNFSYFADPVSKTNVGYQANTPASYGLPPQTLDGNSIYGGQQLEYGDAQAIYANDLKQYNAAVDPLKAQMAATDQYQSTLQGYTDNYTSAYNQGYLGPYTGQQVTDQITSLPGYQFNLDQGEAAIGAKGAAAGLLNSGNTGAALTSFAQGTAMNYYNTYMSQLAQVVSQGEPATMQIAANQTAQGTALAQLQQNLGMAQMNTAQQEAQYQAQMLAQSGTLFNQDAIFNASQQNNSINQAQAGSNSAMSAGIAAGASMSNNANNNATANGIAQLQNAQQVQNSQSTGQGFLSGSLNSVYGGMY